MKTARESADASKPPTGPRAPGPRGSLLLGSLKEFQADSLGFLAESVRRYGDLVRFRFGHIVAYLVNRPEDVEQVLVKKSRWYDKNTRSVAKLRATCGASLLSSDGEIWLKHRRLMQPVFQPRNVAAFGPVIDRAVDDWVAGLDWKDKTTISIDLVGEMMGLTMSIAAKVFFAAEIRDQTQCIEAALDVILQDTWRRLESPIDLSVISPMLHRRSFRDAVSSIDSVVNGIILSRLQQCDHHNDVPSNPDLLDRLIRARHTSSGAGLSDRELRDAVITLLLSGHETTANALVNTMYLIAGSPSIAERLGSEAVQEHAGLSRLPEASKVFAEAIRLYPSIWIIERRAVVDHHLGGFPIRAGSTVILSPYLLHRHPEFWESPETFDPQRFAVTRDGTESLSRFAPCAYLPFGGGPHRCIGEHMATLVACKVLSRVHRTLRVSIEPNQQLRLHPGITLRHVGPLQATLRSVVRRDAASRESRET